MTPGVASSAPDMATGAIASVSALFALLSTAWTLISALRMRSDRSRLLKQSEELAFQSLLSKGTLEELGTYLDTRIGAFSIAQYATDKQAAVRLDHLLAHLKTFLGTPKDVTTFPPGVLAAAHVALPLDLPRELAEVERELRSGATWNGLARLRRYIEMELREEAHDRELSVQHVRSAGQMLRLLERQPNVDRDFTSLLRYSLDVANRAVHGYDVSPDDAHAALQAAVRALPHLRRG